MTRDRQSAQPDRSPCAGVGGRHAPAGVRRRFADRAAGYDLLEFSLHDAVNSTGSRPENYYEQQH